MTDDIRNIGTNRQLFVDSYWIAESEGVERRLHEPDRRDPVIVKEYPWEAGYVGTSTTAFDGEKYRMWYACDDARVIGVAGVNFLRNAYAESEDGINWTKPFLHQEEFEGSRENNLFSTDPGYVNIDANPDARESERFKGFRSMGRREKSAIYAMGSPDGINWRPAVRRADPDRLALRHQEPVLLGRVDRPVPGLHPRDRRQRPQRRLRNRRPRIGPAPARTRVLWRRPLDTPRDLTGLPDVDAAPRHRRGPHPIRAPLHERVLGLRQGARHVPDVPVEIRGPQDARPRLVRRTRSQRHSLHVEPGRGQFRP